MKTNISDEECHRICEEIYKQVESEGPAMLAALQFTMKAFNTWGGANLDKLKACRRFCKPILDMPPFSPRFTDTELERVWQILLERKMIVCADLN